MSAVTIDELLRSPADIARRCREDDGLRELTLTSLAALAVGTAAFGAVLGTFRGELQVVFSSLKVPLAFLATLALCMPAFASIAAAFGRPWAARTMIALVLASAARAALVLLALSPILWLAIDSGLPYHRAVLLSAAVYGLAGLAALGVLLRGLGEGPGRALTALAFIAVFLAVGGQSAWIFRPYLGRPAQESIPFVRDTESTFADSIFTTARSSVGIYDEPEGMEDEPGDVYRRSAP